MGNMASEITFDHRKVVFTRGSEKQGPNSKLFHGRILISWNPILYTFLCTKIIFFTIVHFFLLMYVFPRCDLWLVIIWNQSALEMYFYWGTVRLRTVMDSELTTWGAYSAAKRTAPIGTYGNAINTNYRGRVKERICLPVKNLLSQKV